MTRLLALKSATSLGDVASLLHFTPSGLSYILYKKAAGAKYIKFEIPKRHGGTRQISAPAAELKSVQRNLSHLLQDCIEDINKAIGLRDSIAHGFKRGRSIITNARRHRRRRYVFNVDLKDFFGTINFGRVRGYCLKDKSFLLPKNVATVLAQIACYENALPQGSPCSPVISTLIGHVLDIHLVRLAARAGCTYTRYADDITFSTNKSIFPQSIARRIEGSNNKWMPGSGLEQLVKKCGFALNPLKTRMQYRDSRQEVTGLVVNKKVNVRREYRHTVRAMVHTLLKTGSFDFWRKVKDDKGVQTIQKVAGTAKQLHGMLGFIDSIDLFNNELHTGLRASSSRSSLTTKESLYRRFLLFTEFYAAPTAVLICEGKTDNVYLLHAIRSLASAYPKLATIGADGKIELKIRIYKYSKSSTGRILGINGGTGDLCNLIQAYNEAIKNFKAPGKKRPVIVLVDNDSGAAGIYRVIANIKKTTVAARSEPFIHIIGNMYLVPTPLKPGPAETMIEDFFDATVLSTVLDGKTFDPENKSDNALHYGKTVFAHKVVRVKADTINFDGFNPILSRLEMVIDAHTAMQSTPTAPLPA
jgi:RNA-directed DNA polymerase